ncbi:MAG: hypothetical protein COB12_12890 [Flavobacterium sp.]|nr:MAG: hypothetical protein COB12_12890 [Flavobacterium sp.]
MKKTLFLILIIIISCKEKTKELPDLNSESVEILLPKYDEWKESYNHPVVKEQFEEHNINSKIIGVYLNNETDKIKDSLADYDFEDYAVIINLEKEQKWKIEKKYLEEVSELQKRYLINTDSPKDKIAELTQNENLEIFEKPILLEDYWTNDNIFTIVSLVQPYADEPESIVIMVFNTINVQNHLTYFSYYLDLNGFASVEKAKRNNKKMVTEFEHLNRK